MLLDYHWPGNIRELRNILERAAILCDGGLITDEHLALPASTMSAPLAPPATAAPTRTTDPVFVDPTHTPPDGRDLHSVERAMIAQALQTAKFNKSKAAKALGLTRHQLYIRMRRHGMSD
jgi:DNA-binding NtrC family response regulator